MRTLLVLLLTLACQAAVAAPAAAAPAITPPAVTTPVVTPHDPADRVQVLRAGDTALRVEVIGVDDDARAAMLQRWIADAARAPLSVSGRFPLRDARVEIRQSARGSGDDPVPWGQTRRDGDVRVLLYVWRGATAAQLRSDWTAVHELSHLFHPYLGDDGRWLAEGLASYWQNVLRARAGLIDPDDAWRRLDAGFRRGDGARIGVALAALGRGDGGLMRIYWAGAAYWLEADLALRARGTTLDAVIGEYARCCLRGTDAVTPEDFTAALDRILGGAVFVPLQARYAASTRMPALDAAYRALGIARDGDALRLRGNEATRRLRAAIMRGAPR